MILEKKKLTKIKGDASFRQFYRKKLNSKSSIIVYTNKEKVKNLLIYDAVNKLLIKNRILAPKLYKENFSKNYIEVTDLGENTVFDILNNRKKNNLKIFKEIILLLRKIQKIKKIRVKNFKKKNYKIPNYTNNLLLKEAKLFCDWYVPTIMSKKKTKLINRELIKKIKFLLSKLKQKNDTFVHRDFHVSNLMMFKNRYGVIDNQDAVVGNRSYDLASLIDDVRFKTPTKLKKQVFEFYVNINKGELDLRKFKNDFDILSVLRNLKIIGIFTRLAKRDKKYNYLKFIPYTWKLIELRISDNFLLGDLKNFLDKNFSRKIRNKNGN